MLWTKIRKKSEEINLKKAEKRKKSKNLEINSDDNGKVNQSSSLLEDEFLTSSFRIEV